jgi:hypothetical protein
VLTGNRSFKVELLSKGIATGEANGRSQQVMTNIASAGQCTTTIESTGLRTSSGSGEAVLRKLSSDSGKLAITFSGPREAGRSTMSGRTTVNDTRCGANQNLPESGSPTPPLMWPGIIADTLNDPFTEVIKGSRTLTFAVNAGGVPVPAIPDAGTVGGVSRVPAIPGAPRPTIDAALPTESALHPWLEMLQPSPDLEGEPPVVQMHVEWELVFGGGI